MSVATREQVMDAVFALLKRECGSTFKTYSRRFMTWEQVINSYQAETPLQRLLQPALFLFDGVGLGGGTDTFEQRGRGTPAVCTMKRSIVIYAQLPNAGTPQGVDGTTPGGAVFHPLMESVINALGNESVEEDTSQGTLTLGGLVSHCYIVGESLIVTGEIDSDQGQGMIVIPLEIMLLPSV